MISAEIQKRVEESLVEGGRCQVDVEGIGQFWAEPQNGNRQPGARGSLCIRPEKVTLFSRKPSTMDNSVEGVIKSQTYLGTHTQFDIVLKNGTVMQVFQQNTQKLAKKVFQVSDKVHLGWQTTLSHFFVTP
jgi:ABC-type Fe3+/spermidine/putrescine transport system ATPase subunit